MTDEELIKQIFDETSQELSLKKYIDHASETLDIGLLFKEIKLDPSNKKVLSWIYGICNWHTDTLIVTIIKLKDRGFFTKDNG